MPKNYKSQYILNNTLSFVAKLLNKHKIKNWFIGYGTLLGIIRNNSCINGDDDVDIICDNANRDKILYILKNIGFKLNYNHETFIQTRETSSLSQIDFYLAYPDKNNYHDKWANIVWTNCHKNNKLIKYIWNDNVLFVPNNYEKKLSNRYGKSWKIPQNNKFLPKKTMII